MNEEVRLLKSAGVLITDSRDGLFLIRDEGFASSHDPERDRTTGLLGNIVSYSPQLLSGLILPRIWGIDALRGHINTIFQRFRIFNDLIFIERNSSIECLNLTSAGE